MDLPLDRIFVVVRDGSVADLTRILDEFGKDAVLSARITEDLTVLHWAAGFGREDLVEYLLSSSVHADPSIKRGNEFTPLHSAAMNGHTRCCELLLTAGADANAQTDPQKYAPLHSAAFGGHVESIKVLLTHGARADVLNYRHETPGQTALRQKQHSAATLLGVTPPSWFGRLWAQMRSQNR